jgi:hypothetical protein
MGFKNWAESVDCIHGTREGLFEDEDAELLLQLAIISLSQRLGSVELLRQPFLNLASYCRRNTDSKHVIIP